MVTDNKTAEAPARTEFDKMVAGEWYRYRFGPELARLTTDTQRACRQITALYDDDRAGAYALFTELLGSVGEGADFRPPLYLDYGSRLHVGANTFINADFLTLGGGEITIGANVLIGPSARLYTPVTRSTSVSGEPATSACNRSSSRTTCGWAATWWSAPA